MQDSTRKDAEMEITMAPFDRIIYVGSGHSDKTKCPDSGRTRYVQERITFETRHNGPLILTAKKCLACGAVFLPYKKYTKHWFRFGDYAFLRSSDGKMPSEERIRHRKPHMDDMEAPAPRIDYHEIYKTPAYIKKGLRRPFQGGAMSPR